MKLHVVVIVIVIVAAIVTVSSLSYADDPVPPAPAPAPTVVPESEPAPTPPPTPLPPTPAPTAISAPIAAPIAAPAEPSFVSPVTGAIADRATTRNFAGSVQLDFLSLLHRDTTQDRAFAGPTVELSLKLAMSLGEHVTANVKVCYACHGFEVGMAYFDLRRAEELNVRVGRFTPAFGSFPLRHDPANHATSDKPLPYDMGRMVRFRDWNEGILPTPWVDNGVEVNGSHFVGTTQLDYAVYAVSGPKGNVTNFDFDYVQSRSGDSYYVDNNGQPTVGGRLSVNLELGRRQNLTLGGSTMAGHYDPAARLGFLIAGGDATLQLGRTFVRAEYLARWTRFDVGDDPTTRLKFGPAPDGVYSDYIFKDGFVAEVEHPVDRVVLIARVDGLRRRGNALADATIADHASVVRYTIGAAVRTYGSLQVKGSVERYLFSDFPNENAVHLGIAGPF